MTTNDKAPGHEPDPALPASLRALEQQLGDELEQTQGRWRRRPLVLRLLWLLGPPLVVFGAAFYVLSAGRALTLPVVLGLIALVFGFVSLGVMAERPGLSERLVQGAVVVGLAAFALQAVGVEASPAVPPWGCLSLNAGVAVTVFAAAFWGLSQTALPLRLWHRIGVALLAGTGACVVLWHHCPARDPVHVWVAHLVGPAAVVVVLALLLRLGRGR
jgi:hypothetical protein